MHIFFTEEELKWIDTRVFGWQIKHGCPKEIRDSIVKKLRTLDRQETSGAKNGSNG